MTSAGAPSTAAPSTAAPSAASASGASVVATRVKSAASTASRSGYPHGHHDRLSAHEQDALERFHDVLEERGLWTRGPPASHDDPTLLRFLRARRWAVDDAYQQFADTETWRTANAIDTLYRTIPLDAYEQSRRLYPQWTGRRDRRGNPLYVFEILSLDSRTIAEYERAGAASTLSEARTDGRTPPGLLRLFALYENLTCFVQPLCSQLPDREHPDVPVTMGTNISGVGLKQFWNLKGHMQAASQLATAHYPETLDRIFIIGAPVFFSTVWSWVKRWFDPMTVSKIFVLAAHEVQPTLEASIDPRNIPRKYGGQLDYAFGQLPVPDPGWEGVIEWEQGFQTFPTGPLVWEHAHGSHRLACVAMGTDHGKPRRQTVCTVPRTWPAADHDAGDEKTMEQGAATFSASWTALSVTTDVSEATQTVEPLMRDDGAQTDDAVTNGHALGTLKLADEHHVQAAHNVSPATPTAMA